MALFRAIVRSVTGKPDDWTAGVEVVRVADNKVVERGSYSGSTKVAIKALVDARLVELRDAEALAQANQDWVGREISSI